MMDRTSQEAEIIRLLRANGEGHVSGQTISRTLGISRTAVWKHIVSLRNAGYLIEGSPRKGYVLADRHPVPFNSVEITSALDTDLIGREIFFYESIDSTNTKAMELARSGAADGTVVVADGQYKGRGRLGRGWYSPPGVNLYTSIILRPAIPPERAQAMTLLSAVAVAETVGRFSPVRPHVKWPNDVLIASRKVAGILTEMSSETDRVNFMVVGIGVNLNMDPESSDETRRVAASIGKENGRDVERTNFACTLYSVFERWYKTSLKEGFKPVYEAWKGYFDGVGREVRIKGFTNTEGICLGIDGEGALLVRRPSGDIERIISGDVSFSTL